ncbi:MAG TPA: hypothetical protein PLQ00_09225, partial [Thermoguttaceae bacterium]|nr:hypothetical protein [Thermoguttaceae bacterium]
MRNGTVLGKHAGLVLPGNPWTVRVGQAVMGIIGLVGLRAGRAVWAAIGMVGIGLGLLGGLGVLAAEQLTPEEEQRILRENVERLKQQIAEREGMQKPSPIVPQNAPQSPAPKSPPNTLQAAQAQEKKLLPRPTQAELQQAEKAVQAVFGREIAQARSAQEKTKLAQEMIKTAREEKDSAIRFALAQRAKLLAIQAQDSKQAVQAAEMLAEFEPEGGPLSPKQAADKAHGL